MPEALNPIRITTVLYSRYSPGSIKKSAQNAATRRAKAKARSENRQTRTRTGHEAPIGIPYRHTVTTDSIDVTIM